MSIVAVACFRLSHAARWKGQAPQSTTAVASCSESHCQLSNWSGSTIASNSTGSESAAETISRRRSAAVGSASSSSPVVSSASRAW